MPSTQPTIRIFISSPGDVKEERQRARQVIEGLRRRYSQHFLLTPVLWEELPLQADMSFQQGIDLILSKERGVDIAVFILWSRLGSAVGPLITKDGGGEYRSGTERELDLMFRARRQGDGTRPAILVYKRTDENSFEERLRGKNTSEKKELLSQKELVESFIEETFHDQERKHNIRASHSYDRPVTFPQRLRAHLTELLDQLAGVVTETIWDIDKQGPPFLGLLTFQREHADVFFGRDEEILEARFALREQAKQGCAFLLLTGASGSGKSSLARAGILPDVVQNEVDEQVVAWRSLVVTPAELTGDPVLALARRLASPDVLPDLRSDGTSLEKLARGLREHPQNTFDFGVQPACDELSSRLQGQVRLLLIIDQLEEIFAAHVMSVDDRRALLSVIETLARSGAVWVLATARSDFYHQIQGEPSLVRLLENRGLLPVLPPGPEALQQLIEEPARLAGLRFEECAGVSLASRILRDAAAHAELLPLVEFVLREMFESRTADGLLTMASYDQLGGVEGAVGKKAEQAFLSLSAESQAAFTEVLPLLVTVEVHGKQEAVRRHAPIEELTATPARRALTEGLIAARFLSTKSEEDNTPIGSLAHEALLRHWKRIEDWVTSNREHLRLRARVEQNQQRWEQQSRDASLLLPTGLPLEEGRQLLCNASVILSPETANYIHASIAHHEAEAARSRQRRRAILAAMSILVLLALAGATGAWLNKRKADAKADEALANAKKVQIEKERADGKAKEADTQRDLATRRQEAAEMSAQEADKAKELEIQQRNKAEAALKRNRINLYFSNVSLAERAWLANNLGAARKHLDDCPEDLRGWEWDYVCGLCYSELLTITQMYPAYHAAFNHDASLVACTSAAPDGKDGVCLYDSESGKLVRSFSGHTGPVSLVRFSPDGKLVMSMSHERGEIKLWDTSTGDIRHSLQMREVGDVVFNPDGSLLAAGGDVSRQNDDKQRAEIQIWRVEDGTVAATLPGPESPIKSLAFSPDSKRLVSGGGYLDKGEVKIWDIEARKELLSFDRHTSSVFAVAFSPDGTRVASGGYDQIIYIWEAAEQGRVIFTLGGHSSVISSLAFTHNGKAPRLASTSWDQSVKVWNAETGQELYTLRGHARAVISVAFDSEGQRLVTTSRDRTVKIWNAERGNQAVEMAADSVWITSLAFHPRGRRLAAAGRLGNTVVLWQPNMGVPYGSRVGRDCVAYSTDGKLLAAAVEEERQFMIKVYDAENEKTLLSLAGFTGEIASVAFSPDDRLLAAAGRDGTARLWEISSGKLRFSLDRHMAAVSSVMFTPDGKQLATGSHDRSVRLWDVSSGRELRVLDGLPMPVMQVAVSRDGKHLAAALGEFDKPGEIFVWNLCEIDRGGTPLRLQGHNDWVTCLAFHPQGKRLASGSYDKTVKIWDLNTGLEAFAFRGFSHEVTALAFAPEGQRLAVGERDGKIKIIFAHPPEDQR